MGLMNVPEPAEVGLTCVVRIAKKCPSYQEIIRENPERLKRMHTKIDVNEHVKEAVRRQWNRIILANDALFIFHRRPWQL